MLSSKSYCCRLEDVGKPKAEVAAKRVMQRVSGVNIVPHFCRIEDKELEFYSNFSIIALGLDSIEARSYINSVACSFLGISPTYPLYSYFIQLSNMLCNLSEVLHYFRCCNNHVFVVRFDLI